jgi:lysophospholipase L1-like esterase
VDGKEARVLETASPELGDAVETIQVEDGPHEFEVRALGGGPVRGYGVVFERDVPGVVYDELSQIGSFTQRLDYQDAAHVAGQMARRDIDLSVFILGGNDVQRGTTDLVSDMSKYEAEYTRVLRKFRAGKPQASCLIMTPIDHGYRQGGLIRSRPIMFRLVASQRKIASEQGCAFFDTFEAMGGEGAIGRWFQARPQLAAKDLVHPSLRGQKLIASWLYHALMRGYGEFRRERVGQPLPALDVARPLPSAAQLPSARLSAAQN